MSNEKKKRFEDILNLLNKKVEISVNELAQTLKVSPMTVRRDLNELEQEKSLKRIHGGAMLYKKDAHAEQPYILGEQIEKHSIEKSVIGRTSARVVKPNEMIFMDSGSTTPYIAKNIDGEMPLSVLCYTFQNAFEFYQRENTQLILAGGFYHRDSNVFHSNESLDMIKNLRADKAFISAAGIDPELGLTTYFYFEADIKKAMIASAKKVILVADSTKFGKISATFFADINAIDVVVTDNGISEDYKKLFNQLGIQTIIAENQGETKNDV